MPLKKSVGNMYPWVTHTHAHLGGECPHKCVYCYVDNPRFGRPERYKGVLRLLEDEFKVKYGTGKTIFVENCNDLFAKEVPDNFITQILLHCRKWPDNEYVFQTKNPGRSFNMANLPNNHIFGCTVETNRDIPEISAAPRPLLRCSTMMAWKGRKFITIEPILDFDVEEFSDWIVSIEPEFVNIGADSKGHGLVEPPIEKVMALIEELTSNDIEIREKHNLNRLR
ncbi:MAG: DUF5131 family protein [Syntrophorhabdaceae bacterium]